MTKKVFFIIIIFFVSIVILQVFIESFQDSPKTIIKKIIINNNSRGDILTFKVKYLGFLSLGKAILMNNGIEIYQGKDVYHLSANAQALSFISRFFNAQAQIDSFVDKQRLHSLRFVQTLILPDKPKDERVVLYDQDRNIMELKGVKRQILPDTQDPLSAMFYMQHQPFELDKEFDININTNQKNYRLYAKVIKKQEYLVYGKSAVVWIVNGDIRRRDKNPYHRTTMTIWFLEGTPKIPLLMRAMTNGGSVMVRLTGIKDK